MTTEQQKAITDLIGGSLLNHRLKERLARELFKQWLKDRAR